MNKTELNQLIIQVAKKTIKDIINNKNFFGATMDEILQAFIAFGLENKMKGILDTFKAEYPNNEDFVKLLDDNLHRGKNTILF